MSLNEQLLEQLGGGASEPPRKKPRLTKAEWYKKQEERQMEEARKTAMQEPEGGPKKDDGWRWQLDLKSLQKRYEHKVKQGNGRRLVHGCFVKSSTWSPDGSVLITNSEDNILRLYNLPETLRQTDSVAKSCAPLPTVLSMTEGECIYDYAWYPKMQERSNSCFVASSRDHPIHLWDSLSGKLRATYRAYSEVGEVIAAHSLAFSPTGSKLVAGYRGCIRVFDSETAGEATDIRPTLVKINKKRSGVTGVISTLAFSSTHENIFAAGSFSAQFAIYDTRIPGKGVAMVTRAHRGGITHMKFTPCGRYLATAARKDGKIKLWDTRLTGRTWSGEFRDVEETGAAMHREVPTNQRITFDIDPSGTALYSGCRSGSLKVFNLQDPQAACVSIPVCDHSLNGVHHHPTLPILSLTTGERAFKVKKDCSDTIKPLSMWALRPRARTPSSSSSSSSTSSESEDCDSLVKESLDAGVTVATEIPETAADQVPETLPVLEAGAVLPEPVQETANLLPVLEASSVCVEDEDESLSVSSVSDSIIDTADPPSDIECGSEEGDQLPEYPESTSTLELFAGVSKTFRLFVPEAPVAAEETETVPAKTEEDTKLDESTGLTGLP
eukprot:TRINITY_DN21335_c0_g1_i1.p1 TRINITY_DN21335_c0_g1~~TRINITY_DN21335_c0_g1_i1.p1  ORF type:complete len:611 (+),score=164.29 TRINITY_DN21335_c0_g1_i1:94-1926(+)